MSRDLGAIYTRAWFDQDFADLGPEFALVAAGIDRVFARRSLRQALDVGCGPGLLVEALQVRGWRAFGFDGSPHALEHAKARGLNVGIHLANVLDDPPMAGAPIVICTEVAEHLDAADAPKLVDYLVRHAHDAVVFTAAPPGQGGHDHRNERHPEYWLDLFAAHGWIEDRDATAELKRRWVRLQRLSHMTRNVLVLR